MYLRLRFLRRPPLWAPLACLCFWFGSSSSAVPQVVRQLASLSHFPESGRDRLSVCAVCGVRYQASTVAVRQSPRADGLLLSIHPFGQLIDRTVDQGSAALTHLFGQLIHLRQQIRRNRQRDLLLPATNNPFAAGIRRLSYERINVLVLGSRASIDRHFIAFSVFLISIQSLNTLDTRAASSSHALASRGVNSFTDKPKPRAFANALRRRIGVSSSVSWGWSATAAAASVLSLDVPGSAALSTA